MRAHGNAVTLEREVEEEESGRKNREAAADVSCRLIKPGEVCR